jgi:hypothetical protein
MLGAAQTGSSIGNQMYNNPFSALSSIAPTALGLGSSQAQIPLDYYKQAADMGMQQWQQEQGMADQGFKSWMATLPENNQAMQMMMQYAMGYPFGAQAPTVAQSPWTSMLGGLFGGLAG